MRKPSFVVPILCLVVFLFGCTSGPSEDEIAATVQAQCKQRQQ